MKLSFSVKGWNEYSWLDYCNLAQELGFEGIELHNNKTEAFKSADDPFDLKLRFR